MGSPQDSGTAGLGESEPAVHHGVHRVGLSIGGARAWPTSYSIEALGHHRSGGQPAGRRRTLRQCSRIAHMTLDAAGLGLRAAEARQRSGLTQEDLVRSSSLERSAIAKIELVLDE